VLPCPLPCVKGANEQLHVLQLRFKGEALETVSKFHRDLEVQIDERVGDMLAALK